MVFPDLHPWDLTPRQAIALQRELAGLLELEDRLSEPLRCVAGVDVSYRRHGGIFHAAVVVLAFPELTLIDQSSAVAEVNFPYLPGLLSFRELPVLLAAFRQLRTIPDLVLVDGQGIAHPRRLGLASHLGLWLDLPTIGCAKSRLIGEAEQVDIERGACQPLCDRGEEVGRLLRTRHGVKPLYVSPGHRVAIPTAAKLVLACGDGYRLPAPTRQAHLQSNRLRLSAAADSQPENGV